MLPRLGADAEGTVLLVSLASLTAEPEATALAVAVSEVNVDGDTVEVGWADDGSTTRIGFEPLTVEHR
ncbi:hypothetical protein ACWD6R_18605 [Streptomyces sp. NPDC005151]